MQWLMDIWRRLGALVRRRALERRLDEEFAFHIDQQIEKLRRAGVSSEEARRQAFVRFGGIASTTERTGDEVRLALLEDSGVSFDNQTPLLRRSVFVRRNVFVQCACGRRLRAGIERSPSFGHTRPTPEGMRVRQPQRLRHGAAVSILVCA